MSEYLGKALDRDISKLFVIGCAVVIVAGGGLFAAGYFARGFVDKPQPSKPFVFDDIRLRIWKQVGEHPERIKGYELGVLEYAIQRGDVILPSDPH